MAPAGGLTSGEDLNAQTKMKPSALRVGDRIRILGMPGEGVSGYYLHRDTERVFKKLIARRRSVRIARIDKSGTPWYSFRFRMKSARWEWHSLAVCELDNNWALVEPRRKK
jgi:hypothetical protein